MIEQSTTATSPLRAELYLRGDTYGIFDVQRKVSNRVKRLEANGMFGRSIVAGNWQHIRARTEDTRSGALETYEEFQTWAKHNGYSLEPAFERRTRTHMGTDRTDEVVEFPAIALAIYDEQDLKAVFPCTNGEHTYTVGDALDAFERGDRDWLTRFDAVSVERTEPVLEPSDIAAVSP